MQSAVAIQKRSNPKSPSTGSFFGKGNRSAINQPKKENTSTSFFNIDSSTNTGIQTKLSVGKPSDKYEVEADAMADKVISRLAHDHGNDTPFFSTIKPTLSIQPKCTECAEEEVQKKEEEIQEEETVQAKSLATDTDALEDEVQLKYGECKKSIQTKGEETNRQPNIESQLNSSKGSGSPMAKNTKESMEAGMGADFSKVNIHTGSQAVQMSEQLNAQAFTHGNDIYFNQGKFDVQSNKGQHLLAHELTHTIQQGAAVQHKMIQKTEVEEELKPPKGVTPLTAANGEFSFRKGNYSSSFSQGKNKEIVLPIMSLPKFKVNNEKLLSYPFVVGKEPHIEEPKKKRKETDESKAGTSRQREIWKKFVHKASQRHLNKKVSEARREGGFSRTENKENTVYFFKGKKNNSLYVFGTESQLLGVVKIPTWDKKENPTSFQVDHIMETQLNGYNGVQNYELLESSANASSGSSIMWEMNRRIKELYDVLDSPFYQNKEESERPSLPKRPAKANMYVNLFRNAYTIKFLASQYTLPTKPDGPKPSWNFHQISQGEHLNKIEALTGDEVRSFGTEDDPALFISPTGGTRLELPKKGQYPVDLVPRVKLLARPDLQNQTLLVEAYRAKEDGKVAASYPQMTWYLEKIPGTYGFYVNKARTLENALSANAGVFQSLNLPGMSPIKINKLNLTEKGFYGIGKVLPTIPFIKDADIDIIVDGDGISMSKTFTSEEINLPNPFDATNTSLTVSYGSKGLKVNGNIAFEIKNVGEGLIKARIDSKGNIKLKGEFDVASEMFDKSKVSFGFERTSEGQNKYSASGTLSVGKGKVKGLKKAKADVTYENEELTAKGMAQLDVKGFDDLEMDLAIKKDGYSFGGKINLAGKVDMVKSGELELTVANNAITNGLEISGGGTVVPNIPGLKSGSNIKINYRDGAILIQGEVPYSIGKTNAEGKVLVGITNQLVNENNEPTGEITDKWVVFGKGNVSLTLAKGIAASAEVKLEPNGDLIISGNVGLDHSKEKASTKEIELLDKELFKIGPISTIIFTIPPLAASLRVGIEGGARIYAYITPPHFKELSISLDNFNLTNPEDNFEIEGNVSIGMSGRAGLTAYLTLLATLSVAVAKVTGKLKGSIGMQANAEANANVKAKWSKANGFEIEEGKICICTDARFMAKLSGSIRVYLDLWLAEIDVWNEDLDIASIEFGKTMKTGFTLPIAMKNGELAPGTLNQNDLDVPDISSPQKQQEMVTEAVNEDEKVKPPPPPSKEEAIKAVRGLDSGPFDAWDMLTMDADEARAKVAWNLITRDTYILWLRTKHSKIDWSQAIAVGRQKDRVEFDRFKTSFLKQDLDIFEKIRKIGSFKKNHYLFTEANGSELVRLIKEKKKSPTTTGKEAEPLEN